MNNSANKHLYRGALVCALTLLGYAFSGYDLSIKTADQKAYSLYKNKEYRAAASTFTNPVWVGASLYADGEFKEAASVFTGSDDAQGHYNKGTSLLMHGKYTDAIKSLERALKLQPGWENAMVNLSIAQSRAKLVEKTGGDMTGGKLGADEIVFTNKKSKNDSTGEEEVDGGEKLSSAELRSMWLRQVQTKPADFLKSKFQYQHQMEKK